MTKPTEKQANKFWEWFGFKPTFVPWDTTSKVPIGWLYPNESLSIGKEFVIHPLPDIDLNNIFKYAVPKLDKVKIIKNPAPSGDVFWNVEVSYDGVGVVITHEDPALALFYAIWEAIK